MRKFAPPQTNAYSLTFKRKTRSLCHSHTRSFTTVLSFSLSLYATQSLSLIQTQLPIGRYRSMHKHNTAVVVVVVAVHMYYSRCSIQWNDFLILILIPAASFLHPTPPQIKPPFLTRVDPTHPSTFN